MRRTTAVLFLLLVLTAGCGGAAAPTAAPTQPGGPTAAPGQPTPAPTSTPGQPTPAPTPPAGGPTAAPPAGGTTASVTITGGATPGTFSGTANPECAVGFMGTGLWSANFVILEGATAGQLSEVVLVYDPSNGGMTLSVGVGPIYDTANGFAEYEITSNYSGHSDSGTGTVQLNDAGATAVLHAIATTADGVNVDATINCPSVTRG